MSKKKKLKQSFRDFKNLENFFDKIIGIGWFDRLFRWGSIEKLRSKAYSEYEKIVDIISRLETSGEDVKVNLKEIEGLKDVKRNLEADINNYKKVLLEKENEMKKLENEVSRFRAVEDRMKEDNEVKRVRLDNMLLDTQKEKNNVRKEREEEIEKKTENLRNQWKDHENEVKEHIKSLCRKYNVFSYKKSIPGLSGSPDSIVEINDRYYIFDAKSPTTSNYDKFENNYIKPQVDKLTKYVKSNYVEKNLFLVIPNTALEKIEKYVYDKPGYKVQIITINNIEPFLFLIEKLHNSELYKNFDPEERDGMIDSLSMLLNFILVDTTLSDWKREEFKKAVPHLKKIGISTRDEIRNTIEGIKMSPLSIKKQNKERDTKILGIEFKQKK